MVYGAYVQSILESEIVAWGGTYNTNLVPLFITQKGSLRAALGKNRRYPTVAPLTEIKELYIRQSYRRNLLDYTEYKQADKIFDNATHDYNTRNANAIGIRTSTIAQTFSTSNTNVL